MQNNRVVNRSRAGYKATKADIYGEIEPGMSVRPGYDRSVYESYRPGSTIPKGCTQEQFRKIMMMCRAAYEKVGVVRSVVDMMSEFGAEGVRIIHEDAGPNQFYQEWQRRVRLEDRAERFLSWFYKSGNVVCRRRTGKLTEDIKNKYRSYRIDKNSNLDQIPLEYVFYNPATVELIGGAMGAMSDAKMYALRIPFTFDDSTKFAGNSLEEKVFNGLPKELQDAVQSKTEPGLYYLPLPSDKIHVAHYKKDDSDIWGKSFIYSILDDILYNEKLRLAKIAGFDGYYSSINIWNIGDEDNVPSDEEFDRLNQMLSANVGGGAIDILWNHALTMTPHYPPVEKLSSFDENLNAILLGLGVPESLVGGQNTDGSTGNNYIGLKNLIKRLEAGRRALKEWLEKEIDIIQKVMGFKKRPVIQFSHSDLHDEQAYYKLLLDLVDRNILSDQTMLDRINEFFEIERVRVNEEESLRDDEKLPPKAGPYYKPDLEQQQDHEIKKMKLQLRNSPQNNNSPDNSNNVQKRVNKPGNRPGRPPGTKDSTRRRRSPNKVKMPVGKLITEANRIYDAVDSYIKKIGPANYGQSSMRTLTSAQQQDLDRAKSLLFGNIPPGSDLSDASCFDKYVTEDSGLLYEFNTAYNSLLDGFGAENVTYDDKKLLRIQAYIMTWGIDNDNEDL